MWEVVLPAGSYRFIAEVEGFANDSVITLELEDAKGQMYRQQMQSFQIKKGPQKIEYNFTKPFVPYQGHLIVSGIKGNCNIHTFKLFPDYQKISSDFDIWRISGVRPNWVSRF
jgi:hypothetical protein